jgi:hypothetical protein
MAMLSRFRLIAFLFLAAPAAAAAEVVHYTGGLWYDGAGFSLQEWYVDDGRLSTEPPGRVARTVDLSGRYVIPPYAEAHNHNLQSPFLAERFHAAYDRAGIFYAMMLCGSPDGDAAAATRRLLAERSAVDVLLATACISSHDGHPLRMAMQPSSPDERGPTPEEVHDWVYIVIDTPDDIEAKWPLVQRSGADIVKLIVVHSEDDARRNDERYFGINGLAAELVAPLVRKAKAHGLRVAAHAESAADFAVVVQAGVDFVAHLPGYNIARGYAASDYLLDNAAIAAAARQGIPVITTASAAELASAIDPERLPAIRRSQIHNLQRLRAAGVPLLIGSDRFDSDVLTEVRYLDQLGVFDRHELIALLVTATPQALFPDRRIGQFAEGFEASFLVLDGNPLDDLDALSRVRLRVKGGVVLD